MSSSCSCSKIKKKVAKPNHKTWPRSAVIFGFAFQLHRTDLMFPAVTYVTLYASVTASNELGEKLHDESWQFSLQCPNFAAVTQFGVSPCLKVNLFLTLTAFCILAFDCSNPENCKPINKVTVILKITPWKYLKAKFNRIFRQISNVACQALRELLVGGRHGQF